MTNPASRRRAGAALVGCLVAVGCGAVGDPLPPLLHIPGGVEDLSVSQTADSVEARWTWPLLTAEGMNNTDIVSFELRAMSISPDSPPPPIDVYDRESVVVGEVDGAEAEGPGAPLVLRVDVKDRLGDRVAWAARGINSRGNASPYSEYVVTDLVRPLPSPEEVSLTMTAAGALLQWRAVEGAEAYRVERRLSDEEEFVPTDPTTDLDHLDEAIAWGREHVYRVRSVRRGVAGEPSAERSLVPVDVFPPAPPAGLRAAATAESVELTWTAAPESDLAGYAIRRDGERLNAELLTAPAFSDREATRDGEHVYTVTAFDAEGNESEPSEPRRVQLR